MAEKKAEFVVTDRRRFGTEGDPRPEAQVAEEEKPAAQPPAAKAPAPPTSTPSSQSTQTLGQPGPAEAEQEEEMAPPPTAEEQHQQSEAYKESGKKIDDMIAGLFVSLALLMLLFRRG